MILNFAEDLYSLMYYSSSQQSRYFILTIKQLFSKAHNLHSNLGMKVTSLIILTSSIIDKNLEINIFSKIDSKISVFLMVDEVTMRSIQSHLSKCKSGLKHFLRSLIRLSRVYLRYVFPQIYLHSKPSDIHDLIRNVKALLTPFPGQFYMPHGVFVRLQQLSLKTTLKLVEIV